ncbi:energy coupling factor transporter S component ThiW [Peribacillus muralis]|uniref:energy coupling factor transporter S component ThiW n=1 Tax=Peribacillus muralis TaxID=264697 RepID=UPI001F4E59B5|nr:energy coupling factor transporter S component ThiW [Peribacillus muralis]MCK1992755.1 energy coupling factor transporter S component ThiW [Peribacillus muralis]MCK2013310.1 energy coupling factor transporter S component ThiW [Peribacillus muralis]
MNSIRKMTLTAMITAITTITSSFIFIPVGFVKVFPVQHLANVLTAVLLGPAYAVTQAFLVSLIRNISGTGSFFAFPGSMIGALLAAYLYRKTHRLTYACLGEVLGTGILGSLACYPIAVLLLGEKAALFGILPAFMLSSFAGAIFAFILLKILVKNNFLKGFFHEKSINDRRL